ncbi:metallophosphoesterase [Paenibacillus pabuli]|uniref:metallophosphoesterase n=1 Tax=Paenibacillus pabuli TaxID=1472 RepID=UPI00078560A1|nr:metallophosphoesterase [Paenibacillus pabuli]MEC0126976.1 metallophosphoesterase [Paenibacillus pabuli]
MGRLLAVSDIHGYGHLLKELLNAAGYRAYRDQLVLLGDYVNKGPDSWGTLQLVDALTQQGAIALQGNNERKWLKCMQNSDSVSPDKIQFYRNFLDRLPLFFISESYLFVHAGIRPGVPLGFQTPEDLTEIRQPFLESPMDSRYTIIFGHTSTFRFHIPPWQIWSGDGKLGIDTGAGHGHFLTLVDLTNQVRWYVSVQQPLNIQFDSLLGNERYNSTSLT